MQNPIPGRIEIITGPMFSGKSEELIRRLKRARIARQRVACFKPDIDLRYHRTAIASHSSHTHDAAVVTPTSESLKAELFATGRVNEVDVIGLDDALESLQQMEPRLAQVIELYYFGGLTYDQIAAQNGASPATVHRDIRLARAWLMQEIAGNPPT